MKEHIENLLRRLEAQGRHANGLMEVRVDDVRVAIEFMRAASINPKDERAHCSRVAYEVCEPGTDIAVNVYDLIMRERAAVRSEERKYMTENMLSSYDAGKSDAIRDLGKPKDEAAEREHCEEAVRGLGIPVYDTGQRRRLSDKIMRERAAVRAECADKIKHLEESLMHEYKCANEYHTKLTAAQAEIDQLRTQIAERADRSDAMICSQRAEIDKMGRAMHDGAKLVHEFKTQLTAAQAEIAQLEIEADKDAAKLGAQETLLREVYAEFEAKLTNLRAAEERLVDALDAGMSCEKALGETSAAIEASK